MMRVLLTSWLRTMRGARPRPAVAEPAAGLRSPVLPPTPTDLLGRPVVNLDTPELQRFLAGKRVLVTGAGGSIGSEICRQAMRFCPQRMLLVERAENALFEIDRELRESWLGAEIRPCLADVCERSRIEQIFEAERPQVVFHCAAHKHVPMMEANACEAVKHNVFGTKVVADAAGDFGAQSFVLVSTDKAVNPTSVMGATKRLAELYVQSKSGRRPTLGRSDALSTAPLPRGRRDGGRTTYARSTSSSGGTRFSAVRFGNVLGSSGSVVPIFQRQIAAGGPVTVTHPEMRRFFMTIPEASQLVMQAGAIGRGGEVFVLDMGSPIRIVELAEQMIRRQGLQVGRDIEVRFSGVRPGEKLYEELARDDERTAPTSHQKIRVWHLPPADPGQVQEGLDLLTRSISSDDSAVEALMACVPEYQPAGRSIPAPSTPHLKLILPETDESEIEVAASETSEDTTPEIDAVEADAA